MRTKHCPTCGAPYQGGVCLYCTAKGKQGSAIKVSHSPKEHHRFRTLSWLENTVAYLIAGGVLLGACGFVFWVGCMIYDDFIADKAGEKYIVEYEKSKEEDLPKYSENQMQILNKRQRKCKEVMSAGTGVGMTFPLDDNPRLNGLAAFMFTGKPTDGTCPHGMVPRTAILLFDRFEMDRMATVCVDQDVGIRKRFICPEKEGSSFIMWEG